MISFSTKLHILLIMIVIGFGLYMFLLFKEIRLFQDEIDDMRSTLDLIKAKIDLPAIANANAAPSCVASATSATCATSASVEIASDDDDDDDASVTSNEIKNILTNISIRNNADDVDADDADVDDADADSAYDIAAAAPATVTPPPASASASAQSQDITTMSLEKLQKVNYDDLRKHLRTLGHNIKGTKPDLIKKIQELHGNA
jgi:cytoskeletal protein RodZ